MSALLADGEGRPLGAAGRPFTGEQSRPVLEREGPMLLAANAGSGKTAVLAERFARAIVQDGLDPGSLLAITFTEKAAGELRHRVRGRLAELGALEAARATDQAWISTVHGFCARILRAHAAAAGIDPAFEVLDESAARTLRQHAFDAALAAVLDAADPATVGLIATWRADRLADAIADVHEALRSRGERHPRLPAPRPRAEPADACAALDAARAALLPLLADAGDGKRVTEARDALATCAEVVAGADPGRDDLDGLGFNRGAAVLKTPEAQAYLGAVAALDDALTDREALAHHALLDGLLRDYGARYEEAKARRAVLDYDDLELVARDLLRDTPGVAAALAERFGRVMVDEFQDTSPRQLELLELLGVEDLFVVGDALQSIYGFRHADVRVFRAAQARHRAARTETVLRTNWRTAPEILRTIDAALGAGHDGHVPFVAGRDVPEDPDRAATTLLLVDDDAEEGADAAALDALTDGLPAGTDVPTALEARAVARWVRAGVDAGEHAPQDVVLLLRAAADMPVYERALEAEGLSTLASGGRGFWLRQQVQDLCAWLAALANPRDGHAVLSALASPLGGVGPDGLAILASVARRGTAGDVWRLLDDAYPALVSDTLPPGAVAELHERVDGPTAERLAAFTALFRDTRARLPWLALDELVEGVVVATGYDEHVLALPGGPRRLANVHKLMRLAAEHEASDGRDVRSFIDRARAEAEATQREPEAPVELPGVPAVRLMTVHAAKGLEFPVVVVCDLERRAAIAGPDILVDGDRIGLRVPRHGDDSGQAFDFAVLEAERREAETAEERRILHVAVTRAEDRLVLAGRAKRSRRSGELDGTRPVGWVAAGVLGALTPPAELLAEGSLRVGPEPGARLRADVRWLDARAIAGVGVPAGLAPVAAAGRRGREEDPVGAALGPILADLPAAATAGEAPVDHLSYSSLARYDRCGLRFHLERVRGLAERERPVQGRAPAGRLDARSRGSVVHRVLELADVGADPPGAEEVRAAASDLEVVLTDGEADELAALVAGALATPLMERVRGARRIRREATFAVPLVPGDPAVPLLIGVVDVVAHEDAGVTLVVDYKTDRVGPDDDLDALVAAGYGIQRTFYALAALSAGADRVDVAHLYLDRPDMPALASYGAADADDLRAEVRERAAGILAGDFDPTAEPDRRVCAGCPGRGGLCPVPVELTRRPSPEESAATEEDGVRRRPRPAPAGQESLFPA